MAARSITGTQGSQSGPPQSTTNDDATPPSATAGAQLELFAPAEGACASDADAGCDGARREPSRKPWAWLLRHVFQKDLETCERCGGRMRWKEVATTPDAIARLLVRHGLRSAPGPPPEKRPARRAVLEQLELGFGR